MKGFCEALADMMLNQGVVGIRRSGWPETDYLVIGMGADGKPSMVKMPLDGGGAWDSAAGDVLAGDWVTV